MSEKNILKLKFLGTSSGIIEADRFHSSIMLSIPGFSFIFDAGEGLSSALLKENISYNDIDAIVISHFHPDHFCGLPGFLNQLKLSGRKNPFSIYVHENELKFVEDLLINSFLFKSKFKFELNISSFQNDKAFSINENVTILAKKNRHLEKHEQSDSLSKKINSSSFYVETPWTKFAYTGDIGKQDDLLLFKDFILDCFITEITHISVIDLANIYDLLLPKKIFLTHYLSSKKKNIEKTINSQPLFLREKIFLAYDGMEIITELEKIGIEK